MTFTHSMLDVQQLSEAYQSLLDAPLTFETLAGWLQEWSRLEKQVKENLNDAYFKKVQNVQDHEAELRYNTLLEQVVPVSKRQSALLASRLLELNPDLPEVQQMLKAFRLEQQVRTPKLIELQAEIDPLAATYDDITGAMLTVVDGVTMPGEEAWSLVFDPNREVRQKGWIAYNQMWKSHKIQLGDLLLQLVQKRRHLARMAGFSDYRMYCWAELGRSDYTPQDTLKLHGEILKQVTPLAQRVRQKQARRLGLECLKPWDLHVEEGEPLKPFETSTELLDLTARVLEKVSSDWHSIFANYTANRPELIDIETRPNKGTGGFCEFLFVQGQPHIFMNLAGRHDDLTGFFHETGHALHALLTHQNHDLYWHNVVPMEFNETIAMMLELLPLQHLAETGVYSEEQLQSAVQSSLEQSVQLLPRLVVYDAFQHWLYTEAPEDLTLQMLDQKWLSLWHTYIPDVDDAGLEEFTAQGWIRVLHLYLYPFYMVEYVMAQVYAWQIWDAYLKHPAETVEKLTFGMQLGSTVGLPELLRSVGQSFPIDATQLKDALKNITERIFK